MAGKANFTVIQGDTFLRNVTFRVKASQAPINLTGATLTGKVRKGTTDVALTCTITNAAQGKFSFGLSAAQTGAMAVGIHQIEVQVTYQDGTVKTLFNGNFVIQEQLA